MEDKIWKQNLTTKTNHSDSGVILIFFLMMFQDSQVETTCLDIDCGKDFIYSKY